MTTTKKSGYASFIEANTFLGTPPLCPELRLRFLKEDAPLKKTAPLWREAPHIFDWEGPRPYWAFAWEGGQALADYSCRSVPDLEHPNLQRVFFNRVLPKA